MFCTACKAENGNVYQILSVRRIMGDPQISQNIVSWENFEFTGGQAAGSTRTCAGDLRVVLACREQST